MVVGLLLVLTLSVLQLGLALHVRNTVLDAAAEGARFGAMADGGVDAATERTRELIVAAVGTGYAGDVRASRGSYLGHSAIIVTVRSPLPLIGLVGQSRTLEVTGHAAVESLG
jgi:hypothetical protein